MGFKAAVRNAVVYGFIVGGAMSWFFPTFAGVGFSAANITEGEGHIVGAIFFVGAAIVAFMPLKEE